MDSLNKENVSFVITHIVALIVVKWILEILLATYAHFFRPAKNLKRKGSWAVVTGATDGIGQAIAFELAKKGLNILLLSRTAEKLETTKSEILKKYNGVQVEFVAVDFSNFDAASQARVKDSLKSKDVSVLVNNVGMSYPFAKYFDELTDEEANQMIELNVNSTSRMTRLVLPGMLERKGGYVVNMSSGAAWNPSPLLSQYSGTKGYVEHFTTSMNQEYASKGIHFQVKPPWA